MFMHMLLCFGVGVLNHFGVGVLKFLLFSFIMCAVESDLYFIILIKEKRWYTLR